MLEELKEYSKCKKRKVSAIIVDDNKHILGWGVNTPIIGNKECCRRENCKSGSCLHECNAVHAEVMAILHAGYVKNTTIYISDSPCINCARIIAASGIKKVVYLKKYYKSGSVEDWEVRRIFENYHIKIYKGSINF